MSRVQMATEADTLERGAEILAKAIFSQPYPSPAVHDLERALEILFRKEAERMRFELRGRKSIAHLFPDVGGAA